MQLLSDLFASIVTEYFCRTGRAITEQQESQIFVMIMRLSKIRNMDDIMWELVISGVFDPSHFNEE